MYDFVYGALRTHKHMYRLVLYYNLHLCELTFEAVCMYRLKAEHRHRFFLLMQNFVYALFALLAVDFLLLLFCYFLS